MKNKLNESDNQFYKKKLEKARNKYTKNEKKQSLTNIVPLNFLRASKVDWK